MEQKKQSLNFEASCSPSDMSKQVTDKQVIAKHLQADQVDQSRHSLEIKAILEESERWLKLDWVQEKLKQRWAGILKGTSEPFFL